MLLRNEYRRIPLVLGLHETIDRYMKLVLRKQHAFEQFFLFFNNNGYFENPKIMVKLIFLARRN